MSMAKVLESEPRVVDEPGVVVLIHTEVESAVEGRGAGGHS